MLFLENHQKLENNLEVSCEGKRQSFFRSMPIWVILDDFALFRFFSRLSVEEKTNKIVFLFLNLRSLWFAKTLYFQRKTIKMMIYEGQWSEKNMFFLKLKSLPKGFHMENNSWEMFKKHQIAWIATVYFWRILYFSFCCKAILL